MSATRILIIEDDLEIARLAAMYLHSEGYVTATVNEGALALAEIKRYQPHLVILDLMLPGLSGIEICQQARAFYQGPILVLTACNDEMSEVSLLKLGADDYLTKPVRPHIMAARIAALLRRSQLSQQSEVQREQTTLAIDTQRQRVSLLGQPIKLTDSEYDLLLLLSRSRGEVVSREQCCLQLRGIEHGFSDRSIDMRISSLRKKLSSDECGQLIKTVRNKGYMLINS